MKAALALMSFGVLLIIVGLATGGLSISINLFKNRNLTPFTLAVKKLTDSQLLRLFALVAGFLLTLSGALLAVWLEVTGNSTRTTVVVPGGGGSTLSYTGPSTQGYAKLGNLKANEQVDVICTAYGEPLRFGDVNSSLWDYTSKGWLNDHFVSTGGPGPFANGCTGTTSTPRVGETRPTVPSGPYAIITDEHADLPVRTDAALTAPTIAMLKSGRFVRLQCTLAKGPVIPAPRGLGPGASNNIWDRIVEPSGWVPDSYVATHNVHAVAPSCT